MDDAIPPVVLGAIRDRMHARRFSSPDDPGHIFGCLGQGQGLICAVDDGPDHCMIGRPVGRSADGCVYCLVARISLFRYEQLRDGDVVIDEAFSDSRDISLCGVFEDEGTVVNVVLVRHYRHGDAVPVEYRPPSPFLTFEDDDPSIDAG